MADEMKSGFSVTINFAEGEILTPAKLSAITAQLKKVAEELEGAVGDVHGASWPYTAASTTTLSPAWGREATSALALDGGPERKLDIANIARAIGPMSNLNPTMLNGTQSITEATPVGVHEFALRYPVSGFVSAVTSTDTALGSFVATPDLISIAGDYSITQTGKVFSYSPTVGGTIIYNTNCNEWNGGKNYNIARFNVIPDINQLSVGSGVSLSALDVNGRRVASFPVVTQQQTNVDHDSTTLGTEDINYGRTPSLPKVLVDNFIAGDEIPQGFLYLKNYTTGEVYEEGIYYYNDVDSIELSDIDLVSAIAAGHKFCVITVGTDITTSIDDLRNKTRHTHDRTHGEPFVDVDGISGILKYGSATNSKAFVLSNMPGNFAPQYLHRDGWYSGNDDNANENNIMRGHLVLGPTAGVALGTPSAASFAMVFGDSTTGIGDLTVPKVWRAVTDELWVHGGNAAVILSSQVESYIRSFAGESVVGVWAKEFDINYSWNTPSGVGDSAYRNVNSLAGAYMDNIETFEWYSVQLHLQDAVGDWYGGTVTPNGTLTRVFEYSWDYTAGVSTLLLKIADDGFGDPPGITGARLVIHYKSE
jgi:hypothetical protein